MTNPDQTRQSRPAPPATRQRRVSRRATTVLAAAALLVPALPVTTATAAPSASAAAQAGGRSHGAGEVRLPRGIRPEGITSGPGTRFYVGSLADGRIVTGDLRRGSSRVLLPGAEGRQLRGLYFDPRSGLVWAAGNVGEVGHVWAVNSRTGRIVADVTVRGAVFLNDLVVTRTQVWVTDSRVDRLTRIALGRDGKPTRAKPRFVKLRGEWPTGDGTAINANGIRQLPDGSLVLNNSRVGGLWQVDPRSGRAKQIPVRGLPPKVGITGGDGLELSGKRLFNVRGSGAAEVSVLTLQRSRHGWTAVWKGALTDPRLDVPSTATLVEDTGILWAVNARFGTTDPDQAPYWITPLRVRHR